jgi:hypothetical protein
MMSREENALLPTINFSSDTLAAIALDIHYLTILFVELYTATDEVNNLDPVLFVKHSTAPLAATHYFAIEFDCDSRSGQIKLGD